MKQNSRQPYTETCPPHKLTGNELQGERDRLEQLLADGELVANDASRLMHVRKCLAELGALKKGSVKEPDFVDDKTDAALRAVAVRNGFQKESDEEWILRMYRAEKRK